MSYTYTLGELRYVSTGPNTGYIPSLSIHFRVDDHGLCHENILFSTRPSLFREFASLTPEAQALALATNRMPVPFDRECKLALACILSIILWLIIFIV